MKALQGSGGPGQHYTLTAAGGVISQPGVVQTVGGPGVGADPINALQTLSKQPLPAGMTQPGDFYTLPLLVLLVDQGAS